MKNPTETAKTGARLCATEDISGKSVERWLNTLLTHHFKKMKVRTFESRGAELFRLIDEFDLQKFFPEYKAWDFKSGVVGLVTSKAEAHLAIVDSVSARPTLDDVCALLAYAKVINPLLCMLVSPEPPVDALATLLKTYGRYDVLSYGGNLRHIRLARWHARRAEVTPGSIFPAGPLF